MKRLLSIMILAAAPAFADGPAPGTSDPEVMRPEPRPVLQSGQMQRLCFLFRQGDPEGYCGDERDDHRPAGPQFYIERGHVEGRCNTASCNAVGIDETAAQFDRRKKDAPKKIKVKK